MNDSPSGGYGYSLWSVGIFDGDPLIDKLMEIQGCKGFVVYFYLCQQAFKNDGYSCRWGFDAAATTAKRIGGGVNSIAVEEAVKTCLHLGLFDNGLFVRWGILTSESMQRRYLLLHSEPSGTNEDYWLLEKEDSDSLAKCAQNAENNRNADISPNVTNKEKGVPLSPPLSSPPDKRKEAKENYPPPIIPPTTPSEKETKKLCSISPENGSESTEQQSNGPSEQQLNEFFDLIWKEYPKKAGKGQVSKAKKLKLWKIGYDELLRAIERYLYELKKDSDWRKPQNGSTFFNSGHVDYLDANYEGDYDKLKAKRGAGINNKAPKARIEIINGEEVTVFE